VFCVPHGLIDGPSALWGSSALLLTVRHSPQTTDAKAGFITKDKWSCRYYFWLEWLPVLYILRKYSHCSGLLQTGLQGFYSQKRMNFPFIVIGWLLNVHGPALSGENVNGEWSYSAVYLLLRQVKTFGQYFHFSASHQNITELNYAQWKPHDFVF
jgi:hypothetical protein